MPSQRADKTSRVDEDPIARLRDSGIVGLFRPAELEDAGLTRDQLRGLLRSGAIERVGRGLYRLADAEQTENYSVAMACTRVPNSIVCLLSALQAYEIGTQLPAAVWLAIPHKARVPPPTGAPAPHRPLQWTFTSTVPAPPMHRVNSTQECLGSPLQASCYAN